MKKLLLLFLLLNITTITSFAALRWQNDSREMFVDNKLRIMEINPRTFGAKDLNENGIIEPELGESTGNFVNGIERLDELKDMGINAIHIMPVTKVGKLKALGTAGSLYALSDFIISPDLDVPGNNMTVYQEFENFIYESHLRNIRVIVDLPSCGAYDLYLKNPDLFYKDGDENPVSPADWLDVYLFKTLNPDGSINEKLLDLHKNFIDLLIRAKVDGIRADVATIKPYEFWRKIINYTRAYDTHFVFLAEASNSWTNPPCKECIFTPYKKLLEAGFDGYYSSYFNYKDWNKASDLNKQVNLDLKLAKSFKEKKSAIASFMTHDEQSPVLVGGYNYAAQIIWLNSLIPANSYYVDGIQSGDKYIYPYANQKANKSYTDNLYYYVHKGKMDIFNYSRKPGGEFPQLAKEIKFSNEFKIYAEDIVNKGSFKIIKTNNKNVIAFIRKYNNKIVIAILNKNKYDKQQVKFKYKNYFKKNDYTVIRNHSPISIKNNKIDVLLEPSEIIILYSDKK